MTAAIAANSAITDTNILVYCHDLDDPVKHDRAIKLVDELTAADQLIVSAQVLNEFYVGLTHPKRASKRIPLSHAQAVPIVTDIAKLATVLPLNVSTTFLAMEGVSRHGLAFWDALIWAVAKEHAVPVIYSEDFQHNRDVEGVRFVDPFKA